MEKKSDVRVFIPGSAEKAGRAVGCNCIICQIFRAGRWTEDFTRSPHPEGGKNRCAFVHPRGGVSIRKKEKKRKEKHRTGPAGRHTSRRGGAAGSETHEEGVPHIEGPARPKKQIEEDLVRGEKKKGNKKTGNA